MSLSLGIGEGERIPMTNASFLLVFSMTHESLPIPKLCHMITRFGETINCYAVHISKFTPKEGIFQTQFLVLGHPLPFRATELLLTQLQVTAQSMVFLMRAMRASHLPCYDLVWRKNQVLSCAHPQIHLKRGFFPTPFLVFGANNVSRRFSIV